MLKIIKALYLLINLAIITALFALHFVIREHSYKSSLIFYMFPLPIIITIILALSVLLNKKIRKINLLIATLLLLIWMVRSFKINFSETIKDSDLEIVFWNSSRKRGFLDAFEENKGVPDVLVLAEGNKNNMDALQRKYPNYHFYLSEKEIAIFSKTPINNIEEKKDLYGTTVIRFKVHAIDFFAVDVTGSTDVPRKWSLDFINSDLKNKKNKIILGDFNTPFESKFLNDIKTDFNHAFSEKGNGFRETWFWNIPLLSLDHIWVSKDLKILKTQKIGTFKSDHSMIKTYVRR